MREGDDGAIVQMQGLVENMRLFAYNRIIVEEPNYSIPTFDEWAFNPDKRSDRFAQFCWFIASTAGNFAMRCAGSWFPFCALCPDVSEALNSTYGMAPTQEQSHLLVVEFRKLTKNYCTRSVQLQRDHAGGRALMQMPMPPAQVPEPPAPQGSPSAKRSSSEIEYTGSDGERIKSKRLQRLYDQSVHQMGGGPLSPIPEISTHSLTQGPASWASDRVTGDRMDLDELLNAMQPAPLSTAPPSHFVQGVPGRYRHSEFEKEWYQLRRAESPDLPPGHEQGFQRRGFSPVPPPNTPLSHLQGPLYGGARPPTPVPAGPPPEPNQLEQYVEQLGAAPFNFWP